MKPLAVNGETWAILRVKPDDPSLVDRTGTPRIAATDPVTRRILLSAEVAPPLLDRVLLHEAAHAAIESHGLSRFLRTFPPGDSEEHMASFLESHGIEVIIAVSESLGRPVCFAGLCTG